jgi:hypothetical protein
MIWRLDGAKFVSRSVDWSRRIYQATGRTIGRNKIDQKGPTQMLIAYHGREVDKLQILGQLKLHSGDLMEYETRLGIPVALARLEDAIFEGLPRPCPSDRRQPLRREPSTLVFQRIDRLRL